MSCRCIRPAALRPEPDLLRDQPVVVLDAAEHGQGDQFPVRGWRLGQLGVGSRNRMRRLRWPGAVVVGDELRAHAPDMLLVQEDEVAAD